MLRVPTLRHLVQDASERFGRRPFLIDDPRLGTVCYADVFKFSIGLERQLDALAIAPGARVATILQNNAIATLLFFAIMACGRVLVPIDPRCKGQQLQDALDQATCAAVIADSVHAMGCNRDSRITVPVYDPWEYFAQRCTQRHVPAAAHSSFGLGREDVWTGEIIFSREAIGTSVAIALSEQSLLAAATALAEVYELTTVDRFLTSVPPFTTSGQVFTTLACALAGGSTAAMTLEESERSLWAHVDKYRPSWVLTTPTVVSSLLSDSAEPVGESPSRGFLMIGHSLCCTLIRQFESRFGTSVRAVYGPTEAASVSTCELLDGAPRSIGSCGRPVPMCRVRIDTKCSGSASRRRGERPLGEIWVSGANVFDHYVGDPELTRRRRIEGWFKTGEIGYFDEKGNLFVVDRIGAPHESNCVCHGSVAMSRAPGLRP